MKLIDVIWHAAVSLTLTTFLGVPSGLGYLFLVLMAYAFLMGGEG